MFRKWHTFVLCCVSTAVLAFATSVVLISRASTKPSRPSDNQQVQPQSPKKHRNLALQPEAFAVNRRLGNRFRSDTARSVVVGTVILGTEQQQPLSIVRSQTDSGESVELLLSGRSLTWSDAEGTRAGAASPTQQERLLVERMVFDSPDQFVLAQLRGASYFTMARNVRPDDAVDGIPAPAWTQVRVQERPDDQIPRLTSRWRIYYINSTTGLIDRIVSEWNGKMTETRILQWIEDRGEKFPAHISWLADGEVVMDYRLNFVSHPN